MLEVKKHMKKILAISAASLVGVMTVVSSVLPYDSAYAESSEKTAVLKVAVEGDGEVSVNTGSREYTATEKKAFEKTFEQGAKVTIAAGDGKEIESVSENGKKTTAYDIWDNRRFDFTTKNTDTTLNIILKDKDDGVASKSDMGVDPEGTDSMYDINAAEGNQVDENSIDKVAQKYQISKEDEAMLDEYKNGNYDKDGYKEARLARAKELNLEDYVDKDGFLTYSYFTSEKFCNTNSQINILIKWNKDGSYTITAKEKKTAKKTRARVASAQNLGGGSWVVDKVTLFNYHTSMGNINNGLFVVKNTATGQEMTGLCGDGWAAAPRKGQTLGAPMTAEEAVAEHNAAKAKYPTEIYANGNVECLRRSIYYGYNGPGYAQWKAKLAAHFNIANHPEWANDQYLGIMSSAFVSDALGNYSINPEMLWVDCGSLGAHVYGGTVRPYAWTAMMNELPAPPADFEVYVLPNTETAGAAEGHYGADHTRQPAVVYNTKKPQPYGQITISKTYDAKKDPVTETTYTESVIKDEYSGYVPKPSEEELAKADSEASAQTADTAKAKDGKTDTSSKLPEKYYEIFKTEEGEYFVKMTDRTIRKTTVLPATEFFDVKTSTQKSTGEVKFKITAGTDIYTAKGDLNVKKGDPIKIGNNKTGVYEIGKDGTLSKRFMINKNGQTIINIQEVSAQDNYSVDGKVQSFVFETKEGTYEDEAIFDPVSEKSSTGKFDNNIITIGTKASNAEILDGKTVLDSDLIRLKDTVSYKGLTPGKKYKMTGLLMDKETKKNILSRGNPVTAEVEFTPDSADGTVDVVFEFDATGLGGHDVVAYEHLRNLETNTIIASHEDIEDEDQTVHVNEVKIGTMATVNGSHEVDVPKDGMITLKDKVSFEGLIPNYEYTIKGVLMDKATGEPVKDNGKEVTAEKTFTPGAEKGWTVMEFKFNAKSLKGHDVVVFETVSHELGKVTEEKDDEDKDKPEAEEPKQDETDKEETPSEEVKTAIVAEHKDIEDKGQTVHFNPDKPETGLKGKTNQAMPYILGAGAAVILIGIAMVVRKKKQSK